MRITGKILAIPAVVILKMVGAMMSIISKIGAFIVGPFLIFAAGCSIYCIMTSDWKNLLVFVMLAGTVIIVFLMAGLILGAIDILGSRIGRFLRS